MTAIRYGLYFTCIVLEFSLRVHGGTTEFGGNCTTTRDHLDPNTHKFMSDCSDLTYCSGSENGTCVPRTCRRDEFPFGYTASDVLPPLCPLGSFCPDEGNECRAQVSAGGTCQPNRDEQCAPGDLYGSICLHSVCLYANVTLGSSCVIDNTTYTDVGFNGEMATTVIVRDNCQSPQYYCGQSSLLCEQSKLLGSPCQIDQECEQRNCVASVCAEPPETPLRVAPWQCAITALCVIGAMIAICLLLTLIHKRHRLERYRELREYYLEQQRLRRSIIALHSAAAAARNSNFESKEK